MVFVVEIDEGKIETSAPRAAREWFLPILTQKRDQWSYVKDPCVVGGVIHWPMPSRDDADFFADHMVERGIPRTAVRVREVAT